MNPTADLIRLIDEALPQTQCTRCGYPDCHAYAEAIALGDAGIDQCPPGGRQGIDRLAALTGRPALPLNTANGAEGPRQLAVIDEDWCIGCTLCIKACPVDCIVGAAKQMHTVIDALCTGCELCLPVCPVDCISLQPVTGEHTGWDAWSEPLAQQARQRYGAHRSRIERDKLEEEQRLRKAVAVISDQPSRVAGAPVDDKRAMLDAVLARARARRGNTA